MRIRNKLCFTLIEVLIVITLLSIIGGAMAINIRKAVTEQQYHTEVELLVDTLRLAQDLMLIVGADIHVFIRQAPDDRGILSWIEADGGVPKNWERVIARSRRVFTSIRSVSFKDQRPFPIVEGQLNIRFQSQGSLMSRGVLRLSPYTENMQGPLKQAICLPGYPAPMIIQSEANQPIFCREEDKEFDTRLTSQMQRDILEDTKTEQKSDKAADQKTSPEKPDKKVTPP